MKTVNYFLVLFLAGIALISSCKKDEEVVDDINTSTTLKTAEYTLSRTTDYGDDWIYFSFATGAEVSGVDSLNYTTSTSWDIAFNRYNVRTNSGSAGIGEGGVYDAGSVEWSTVVTANEGGYTPDDTIQIVTGFNTDHSPIYLAVPGSSVFIGCIDVVMGSQGPTYPTNDHIYVLKTANGKYAKIWIKSFFNDNGDSGYVNFKYSYQTDGSRTIE
jgi:hypothetical protein